MSKFLGRTREGDAVFYCEVTPEETATMNFAHFEIHVTRSGTGQYFGSWRRCATHNVDNATHGESQIPLGRKLTTQKLEDFCLDVIAAIAGEKK